MTILALYSNKGGVGKTTTAVNLAYLAARTGGQTLLCDLDPQSSATFYFHVEPKLAPQAQGFLKGGKAIQRSIKGTGYKNLDLLPADLTHRNLDITFNRLKHRKHRLDIILEPLRDKYDWILLDCPPAINLLAENVFNSVDYLLVPLLPTTLCLRTYRQLLTFLGENGYPLAKVYAFFSMVDRQNKLHRQLGREMYLRFDHILWNPVPYLPQVEQMGLYRAPVPAFAPDSTAAQAYQTLWTEIRAKVVKSDGGLQN